MAAILTQREFFTPKEEDGNLSLSTREKRIQEVLKCLGPDDWIEFEDGTHCTSKEEIMIFLNNNMENQVSTIICPNCGASTSNRHNCEFCGSYLVQKASLGIDMKGYQEIAKEYYSASVEKVIRTYHSILEKHNLTDGLYLYFEVDGKVIVSLLPTETFGIKMMILETIIAERGLVNKFKNSNVFKAFNVEEGQGLDSAGKIVGTEEYYEADFGSDCSGAALVVNQLLKDIFQINPEDIIMTISGGCDDEDEAGNGIESHFAKYNKDGDFIYGRGDGKNQFETVEGVKDENNLVDTPKNKTKKWIWPTIGLCVYVIIKIISSL